MGISRKERRHMRVSRHKLLPLLASLLLVSLGIAGCGEAPGTSHTGSSSSAGAMKLNVGQISDSIAFFPFYVAEQQGYIKDEGPTLGDRPRLGTGAKLAAALSAGSIDIAGGVITDAFNLARVNSSVKLIGSLVNGYYVDITASKRFEQPAHVTKESKLAAKVKALRGKKIGITGPGSGTEALVIYLFKQHGMDGLRGARLGPGAARRCARRAARGPRSRGRGGRRGYFERQRGRGSARGRSGTPAGPGGRPALRRSEHGGAGAQARAGRDRRARGRALRRSGIDGARARTRRAHAGAGLGLGSARV